MQKSILEKEVEIQDVPVPTPTPGMGGAEGEVARLQVPKPNEAPGAAAPIGQGIHDIPIQPPQMPSNVEESIHEIVESVIDERWRQLESDFGDVALWKTRANDEITAIKQEVIRLAQRFANLENSLLGKVTEYDDHVMNVTTEMKALEKVFEKIVQPLTTNIKELNKITKELKSKK